MYPTSRLAADLPGEDHVDVERELVLLEGLAVEVGHAADPVAHDAGGVVEGLCGGQAETLVEVAPQQGDDRLRARQAPAGQHDEEPLLRTDEGVHLPADIHLVAAGIGARIRGQDQALAHRP